MSQTKILAIFIVVLVISGLGGFLGGQAIVTPQTVTQIITKTFTITKTVTITATSTSKQAVTYTVYFAPNPEIENHLIELIDEAQNYVYAAFYDFDLINVAEALVNAKNRGVDVEVVVDSDSMDNPAVAELQLAGIVIGDNDPDYMHNKFMIIDDRLVWTGSMNPTYNGINKNNNNVVIISGSTQLVEDFKQEFEELRGGIYGGGLPVPYSEIAVTKDLVIEVYFAPEDNVEAQIIEEINKAKQSIYFATFAFTSKPIANALIEKFNQGVTVKGIYESFQAGKYSTYELLKNSGIEVIKDKNPAAMHHKFFVIDGETVITGSFNPTKHANEDNDENIIIIHNPEIAKLFTAEFEKLLVKWCKPALSLSITLTVLPPFEAAAILVSGVKLNQIISVLAS